MELCKEGVATDVILRSAATQWSRDGRDSPFANRGGKRGVLKATENRGTPIWQMWFLRFGSGKTSFHVFDGPRKAGGGQSLFLGSRG